MKWGEKMNSLSIPSGFLNNAVIILDCLGSKDLQTGKNLYESIEKHTGLQHSPLIKRCQIGTAAELLGALDKIRLKAEKGLKPIIHIEAHGGAEAGIGVGDTQECVSWNDLVGALGKINKATKNNLGVVMASCFGLHAISEIQISVPAPYYFLIGCDKEILAMDIDRRMEPFYHELLSTGSLNDAMKKVEDRFQQFHAERYFYISFGKYILKGCVGKAREERIMRLTQEVAGGGNRRTRRRVSASARKMTRPTEATFTKYADKFLHGRITVTFREFIRFISSGHN